MVEEIAKASPHRPDESLRYSGKAGSLRGGGGAKLKVEFFGILQIL